MDGSDFRLSLGSHAVESEKCMDNNFCSKCEIAKKKQYLLSHQFKGLNTGKGTKRFIDSLSIVFGGGSGIIGSLLFIIPFIFF